MRLIPGDVFKIKTKIGFGNLQYIETNDLGIEFVRVLESITETGEVSQDEVDQPERWSIGFPLKAAVRKKVIEKVGTFDVPKSYVNPEHARSEHVVRGEFLGWHIVNKATLKREFIHHNIRFCAKV